mmetsp:Transcript_50709/g.130792  ORF Transcript_50709/g.130792 Transcript_50709/m.130792 type:complete len:84 (+) Transcript_50709:369-620(+)
MAGGNSRPSPFLRLLVSHLVFFFLCFPSFITCTYLPFHLIRFIFLAAICIFLAFLPDLLSLIFQPAVTALHEHEMYEFVYWMM